MTTAQTTGAAETPAATPTRDGVLDAASAQDKARLARDEEKRDLVTGYVILADRGDAVEKLQKDKHDRLEYLMQQDSDRRIAAPAGTAAFEPRRSVTVADAKLVAEKIDIQTLVEYFKPSTALIDALAAQGIAPSAVGLQVEEGEGLVVRRPQGALAKEVRKDAIERTKAETEATIARIVARMKAGAGSTP